MAKPNPFRRRSHSVRLIAFESSDDLEKHIQNAAYE